MKKYMILAAGTLLTLSSCSTITHTAQTASVSTEVYTMTVADLTVEKQKAETTKEFKWNPLSTVSLSAQKETATAELLKQSGADLLVEPQYVVNRRGLFRGGSVTVSGYPATYSNFRAMSKADAEKIAALNGATAGSTTVAATFPVINTTAKKAVKREKPLDLTQSSTSSNFISIFGGPFAGIEGGPESGGYYGLMYGHYGKKWGWYGKLGLATATCRYESYEEKSKTTPNITVGVIKTMGKHWNALLGIGLGGYFCTEEYRVQRYNSYTDWRGQYHSYYTTNYVKSDVAKFSVPVELAFQYHVSHFNCMVGVNYATPCGTGDDLSGTGNVNIFLGFGLNF